ncbi:MAG: hypothetical protein VYC17_06575 [Nitrospinota bacterium]|nr:hypothetical protein [Nitrospinota bacterium]
MATYNVLIVAEFKNITEDALKEIALRLEEHNLERIPTLNTAWEFKVEAADESEAKEKAMQEFVSVCRTYPFECAMLVHAGTSQILRRRKKFES